MTIREFGRLMMNKGFWGCLLLAGTSVVLAYDGSWRAFFGTSFFALILAMAAFEDEDTP